MVGAGRILKNEVIEALTYREDLYGERFGVRGTRDWGQLGRK